MISHLLHPVVDILLKIVTMPLDFIMWFILFFSDNDHILLWGRNKFHTLKKWCKVYQETIHSINLTINYKQTHCIKCEWLKKYFLVNHKKRCLHCIWKKIFWPKWHSSWNAIYKQEGSKHQHYWTTFSRHVRKQSLWRFKNSHNAAADAADDVRMTTRKQTPTEP